MVVLARVTNFIWLKWQLICDAQWRLYTFYLPERDFGKITKFNKIFKIKDLDSHASLCNITNMTSVRQVNYRQTLKHEKNLHLLYQKPGWQHQHFDSRTDSNPDSVLHQQCPNKHKPSAITNYFIFISLYIITSKKCMDNSRFEGVR